MSWNRWHFPLRDAVPCAGVERSAWWRACGDAEHPRHENEISPLLLIRDTLHGRVIIADGYHRLCAVYSFDEDAVIPCKIA